MEFLINLVEMERLGVFKLTRFSFLDLVACVAAFLKPDKTAGDL